MMETFRPATKMLQRVVAILMLPLAILSLMFLILDTPSINMRAA
jgi:hypothetical protein